MVGTLAMLTVTLSGLSVVRLQVSQVAFPVPSIRLPDWTHRLAYGLVLVLPPSALLLGIVLDSSAGSPKRALTGAPGGVAAALAAVAVVVVMFVTSASGSPGSRRRSLVVSSVLVVFVAIIVTARFVLID